MKTINLFSIIILIAVLISSCSKLKKELPEPTSPTLLHAAEWNEPARSEFHGNYLKENKWKLADCIQCHGSNFEGGTSNVSCYSCHESYPHKSGWLIKSNMNYHGLFLKTEDWSAAACMACHGSDLQGGNTDVKCATCHESFPHKTGWVQTANANFHGKYLKTESWELFQCTGCHGNGYDGGSVTNVSCMTSECHVDAAGQKKSPEACNTCHGVFTAEADSASTWSPPKSVDGETSTSVRGVGAHQKHLATGEIGKSVKCKECHLVPSQIFASGHLNSPLPANVLFNDTLANLITGDGTLIPNPTFSTSNLRCSNSYCHGNWKLRKATSANSFMYSDSIMVGANYSPLWTGGTTEAACGSCHGLPPTGHYPAPVSSCGSRICHSGIVNNSGTIIDKSKHINGKIDFTRGGKGRGGNGMN
jgi:predicted CxxxxCH...CXXCH cytochrome family protein